MTRVCFMSLGAIAGIPRVIDMELLSLIRRWHYRDHMPTRKIHRRTAVEVRFKVPERPSRLDPFADKLSRW
jgi:hypothetical protein